MAGKRKAENKAKPAKRQLVDILYPIASTDAPLAATSSAAPAAAHVSAPAAATSKTTDAAAFVPGSPLPPEGIEVWFAVGGQFPSASISNHGNFRRNLDSQKQNAETVRIVAIDGKTRIRNVARLVARVFLGPPPSIHHKLAFRDQDSSNRRPSNVYYKPRFNVQTVETRAMLPGEALPPDYPEQWRLVGPEYPNVSASTLGRVHNGIIIVRDTKSGKYRKVEVQDKTRKCRYPTVHCMVALAFHGPRPSKRHDVAHGDDVGTNNVLSNISYKTKSENGIQAQIPFRRGIVLVNSAIAIPFSHAQEAADKFGISINTVYSRCRRKSIVGDYRWMFSEPSKKQPRVLVPIGLVGWKRCISWPAYECLADGRVRKIGDEYFISQTDLGDYFYITFHQGGKKTMPSVHLVVCETFHGLKPSPRHEANHLNEQKKDNRAINLAWTLHNAEYSIGQPCEQQLADGTWKWFASVARAHRETDVAVHSISNVINGTGLTAGGFLWRKAEQRRPVIPDL